MDLSAFCLRLSPALIDSGVAGAGFNDFATRSLSILVLLGLIGAVGGGRGATRFGVTGTQLAEKRVYMRIYARVYIRNSLKST